MQIALISDIHGNLEALDTVLQDIDQRAPGARIICAGDIVGYGPDPGACIQRLAAREIPCVMGNHDEMVLGRRDFSRCVYAGIVAARWTQETLSTTELLFLRSLPSIVEVTQEIVACHGTLDDSDKYVSSKSASASALEKLKSRFAKANLLICGHTHHAAVYCEQTGYIHVEPDTSFSIPSKSVCMINPGAVGQSRDGTRMARYAVLDTDDRRVCFIGLTYDHVKTVTKMRQAGLVPIIDLQKPKGAAKYVEAIRKRWARMRYRSNPLFG